MVETIRQLTYKASHLFLNKSHIRPIILFSQTNEKALGSAAHDLIKHISAKHPSVFKTHSDDLCHSLESQAPTPKTPNDPTALDTLKACSTFAQRFGEGMPKERKFFQSMIYFALYGTPPKAAKHAVTILLSASDKKEKHASDLVSNCVTGFKYGSANFLSRLACLSQLMLLDGQQLEDEADPVLDIAMSQILLQNRRKPAGDDLAWEETADEECEAKIWALKILVNRVRAYEGDERAAEIANPVFKFLDNLVQRKDETSNEEKAPSPHRTRLRLEAALEYLKLCKSREFDAMVKPPAFNALAMVAQDEQHQVRDTFARKVKKMLGQDLLPSRFYSAIFLLAYEPSRRLTNDSTTWLRARALVFARSKKVLMEPLLARFLSLLAYHPDFSRDPNDLIGFVEYVMFYLKTVASEDNISLVYHVAQRVKSVQDAVHKSTDAKGGRGERIQPESLGRLRPGARGHPELCRHPQLAPGGPLSESPPAGRNLRTPPQPLRLTGNCKHAVPAQRADPPAGASRPHEHEGQETQGRGRSGRWRSATTLEAPQHRRI